MRLREDVASAAGWAGEKDAAGRGALVAAHVDACRAALEAATARDAPPPDKRLLGATLAEALGLCVRAFEEGGEGAEDEDEDEDEGDEDTGSGSDSDSDSDSDSEDPAARAAALVEGETEAEMLERYAEVARELAASGGGAGEDEDEAADEDALGDVDDAFDGVLEGASSKSADEVSSDDSARDAARRFAAWAKRWRDGGASGARLVALVDAKLIARFDGAVARDERARNAAAE